MYKILKSFKGSQNGSVTTQFNAGESVEISDYLLSCIPSEWVEKIVEKQDTPIPEVQNKAIKTTGKSKKGSKK